MNRHFGGVLGGSFPPPVVSAIEKQCIPPLKVVGSVPPYVGHGAETAYDGSSRQQRFIKIPYSSYSAFCGEI